MLHHEQYHAAGQDAGVRAYEDEIAEFYRHQRLADSRLERVLVRFASPGALGKREMLRKELAQRGFGLD